MNKRLIPLLIVLLLGCADTISINPNLISIFFNDEFSDNIFLYDAAGRENGQTLLFSTVGNDEFVSSVIDPPTFNLLMLDANSAPLWDTIVSDIANLDKEKFGFPSYIVSKSDSVYYWAWNQLNDITYIIKLSLDEQSRFKSIQAKGFFADDKRFDTLSIDYTLHRLLKTPSGYAILFLGIKPPNFSIAVKEVDEGFSQILNHSAGHYFDIKKFFPEESGVDMLTQVSISALDRMLQLVGDKQGHFYYTAPNNTTETYALFSTQKSNPVFASPLYDVTSLALTNSSQISICISSTRNQNLTYFIPDITVLGVSNPDTLEIIRLVEEKKAFRLEFMNPETAIIIASVDGARYLVGGTTRIGGAVLNVINGQNLTSEFFENQKYAYTISNLIVSSGKQEALMLGSTDVFRTYSRSFLIRIPFQKLFIR